MSDRKQLSIKTLKLLKWCFLLLLISLPVMATLYDYCVTWGEPIYIEATWNIKK